MNTGPQTLPTPPIVRLRLFVAGNSLRSQEAIKNLRRICDDHLDGNADLEVIDIYQQPDVAQDYQVMAAPTLLKLLPLPVQRIAGDLSEPGHILRSLNLMRAGHVK
jgi:circadian clock protein KaiB